MAATQIADLSSGAYSLGWLLDIEDGPTPREFLLLQTLARRAAILRKKDSVESMAVAIASALSPKVLDAYIDEVKNKLAEVSEELFPGSVEDDGLSPEARKATRMMDRFFQKAADTEVGKVTK